MGIFSFFLSHINKRELLKDKYAAIVLALNSDEFIKANEQLEEYEEPYIFSVLEEFSMSKLIEKVVIITRSNELLLAADIVKEFDFPKSCSIVAAEEENEGIMRELVELSAEYDRVVITDMENIVSSEELDGIARMSEDTGGAASLIDTAGAVCVAGADGCAHRLADEKPTCVMGYPMAFEIHLLMAAFQKARDYGLNKSNILDMTEDIGMRIKLYELKNDE